MLTVVRFTGKKKLHPELARIGKAMNSIRPGVYEGMNRTYRKDGFVCDVLKDPKVGRQGVWWTHRQKTMKFISDFRHLIKRVTKMGGRVQFDVAIYTKDTMVNDKESYACKVMFIDPDLTKALASCGAGLVMSYYLPIFDKISEGK